MSQEDLDFLAPAEGPEELGRLGSYRVLKQLGRGGMGMVFLAEDPQLKRSIALKVMLPQFAQKASSRERFLREARAAAAIEHDNIIPIHQVGEDRGVPFIAMPFLKGASLEDYLKKKTLTLPQICRIGRETARGLAAAHDKGIFHRDIKPANLWLDATAQGRTKILDFGLARPTQDDTNLTQDGAIVGTPSFMAPEQACSGAIDGRTDLFSLGAVLYLLCTGQKPFPGTSTLQILNALATTNPKPVRDLNPEVPAAFADLIMKLLEKEPAKRPGSAKAVFDAIVVVERDLARGGDAGPAAVPAAALGSPSSTKILATPNRVAPETLIADRDKIMAGEPPRKKRTSAAKKQTGMPKWIWLAAGGALLAVALLVVILVLSGGDKQGTIALASEEPGVEIVFEGDNGQIKVNIPEAHDMKLKPGAWRTRLERPAKHLIVEPAEFQIAAGQTVKVQVRRVAVPKPPDPPPIVVVDTKVPPLAVAPYDAKKALEYQQLWAKHLGRKIEETNTIGMKLRLIPPGEFLMGAPEHEIEAMAKKYPESEHAYRRMGPQHPVRLTRPKFMGTHEVTIGQFRVFVSENMYKSEVERNGKGALVYKDKKWQADAGASWQSPGWLIEEDLPVSGVTWNDAVAFCDWLSGKEGRRYRLPTEAEWEHACRAGTTTPSPYGETTTTKQAAISGSSSGKPSKVGQLEPNAFGLRDMAGNLWEYCADYMGDYQPGLQIDPRGPDSGASRIARGYGYDGSSNYGFSANRVNRSSDSALVVQGFRVVCEIDGPSVRPPQAAEWQPLFNGKDLPGTVGFNPDNLDFKQAFTVVSEDGRPAVKCVAAKPISMYLHPGLPAYHLRMQFKWPKEGAVGIFEIPYLRTKASYQSFRLHQHGNLYFDTNRLVDEGKLQKGKAVSKTPSTEGDRSLLVVKQHLKPQGEWNQADLIVLGDTCIHLLNGEVAVIGGNVRQKDAKGEWAPVTTTGSISLTCEGMTPVYFRDLEIRPVSAIPAEVKTAWKVLFNGKDLDGWLTSPLDTGQSQIFMEEGQPVLRMTAPKGLKIGSFGSYHLRFDYKAEKDGSGGVHHFQRPGFDLTIRPGRLLTPTAPAIGSTGNSPWTYQQAELRDGQLTPVGPVLNGGKHFPFSNVVLNPKSPWQKVEIIRLGDSFVYVANGRVVAALTNLREVKKDAKDLATTSLSFWADYRTVSFRNIEIRTITALPEDLR